MENEGKYDSMDQTAENQTDNPMNPSTENQVDEFMDDVSETLEKQIGKYKSENDRIAKSNQKRKKKQAILTVALSVTMSLVLVLVITMKYIKTEQGQEKIVGIASELIYPKFDYDGTSETLLEEDTDNKTAVAEESAIYNIALLGSQDGNTDTMLIATLDTEENTLKLTSILRDIYVEIPNHENAKLNAAYQIGGIDKFYQTILNNFDVSLDGYVLVGYSTLEYVVDKLDGIEISLTSEEAGYLNRTNYISNPAYRNVQSGSQIMNGNQVLGYCRIRSVPTSNDEHYDFGRTSRQRVVLKEIYETLLSKNVLELISIMNDILNETNIKTDITKEEFKRYITKLLQVQRKEIDMYRIPSDGTYSNEKRTIASRSSDVLIINDWDATREELKDILYGTND